MSIKTYRKKKYFTARVSLVRLELVDPFEGSKPIDL